MQEPLHQISNVADPSATPHSRSRQRLGNRYFPAIELCCYVPLEKQGGDDGALQELPPGWTKAPAKEKDGEADPCGFNVGKWRHHLIESKVGGRHPSNAAVGGYKNCGSGRKT